MGDIVDVKTPKTAATKKSSTKKTTKKSQKTEKVEAKETRSNDSGITMEYLLDESIKFINGKITLEEFDAIAEKLTVRAYLPMMDKLKAMMYIIFDMNNLDTEQNEVRILNLQKNLFFDVILQEYAGVYTLNPQLKTYTAYDVLYPIWSDYILQYCYNDYKLLEKMIEDSLNLYHIQELSDLLETVDYKKLQKISDEHKKTIDDLKKSKKLIEHLRELYVDTNPTNKQITEILQEQVLTELKNNNIEE